MGDWVRRPPTVIEVVPFVLLVIGLYCYVWLWWKP
jgi:hypothetical protein